MKYQTRPTPPAVIDAEQFPDNGDPAFDFGAVESFAGVENARVKGEALFEIRDRTNNIWLPIQPGDFVCRGEDGRGYWTVRANIFNVAYEPAAVETEAPSVDKPAAKAPAARKATAARKPAGGKR